MHNEIEMKLGSGTTERVVDLLRERDGISLSKYDGKTMDRGDLTASQWARHLIEEMSDGIKYAFRMEDGLRLLEEARQIIGAMSGDPVAAEWIKRYDLNFGQVDDKHANAAID